MFLHPPVFSLLPPGLLLNLKRRGRERQREKHERIREHRVKGDWGGEGGERAKQREKSGKRLQAGKDEETETNTASQKKKKKQVERKDVDVGWAWCTSGVLNLWVLGVFRLRSVRLSKHRAHCNALLWSSGHRADSQLHQHSQQRGPSSSPALTVAAALPTRRVSTPSLHCHNL